MFVCIQRSQKLLVPQMDSLISSCWSRDPSSRPSAAEIFQVLGEMTYCNLEKIIHLPKDGIIGQCHALHWTKQIDVRFRITASIFRLGM